MKKIALDISQMAHLQELGHDCSDASMYWLKRSDENFHHLVIASQSCALLSDEESYAYTLEDILKHLQKIKYKSIGFPILFLYYNYEVRMWGVAFRNPKNFDNPNIEAETPLEAAYKMLVWYLNRKNTLLCTK